jgi:hypothetical protein
MFDTTDHSGFATGFHITFANGWTASVQWGYGNYCANRDKRGKFPSATAEIAAFRDKPNGGSEWHSFGKYDPSDPESLEQTVKGWVKPEQVAEFLLEISIKK